MLYQSGEKCINLNVNDLVLSVQLS